MQQKFRDWLIQKGYSETGAPISYPNAIPQISTHYSENTGTKTDVYSVSDQYTISQIAHDYRQSGKFADFGNEQHGRFRAAITKYSEFLVHELGTVDGDSKHGEDSSDEQAIAQTNFAYEKDLQTTLCAQLSELFPGYKIFGEANVGVEYQIEGKRIDVLLEQLESGDLLVVELKSGVAKFPVFGQICMYLGLLQTRFPNKNISGVIVAGAIDEGLRNCCKITDMVRLMIYTMSLELEEV